MNIKALFDALLGLDVARAKRNEAGVVTALEAGGVEIPLTLLAVTSMGLSADYAIASGGIILFDTVLLDDLGVANPVNGRIYIPDGTKRIRVKGAATCSYHDSTAYPGSFKNLAFKRFQNNIMDALPYCRASTFTIPPAGVASTSGGGCTAVGDIIDVSGWLPSVGGNYVNVTFVTDQGSGAAHSIKTNGSSLSVEFYG